MDDPGNADPASPLPEESSPPALGSSAAPQDGGVDYAQATQPPELPAPPQLPAPQPEVAVAPPTYPGMPGVPLSWAQPVPNRTSYSDAPSAPVYPGVPSVPGYPPSYPGYPSMPLTPYGAPLSVPLQSGSSLQRTLSEPFPVWMSAALGVAAVALVLIAFFAAVLAGQTDWADGARTAGLVAFALAFIGLILAILRGALGRRSTSALMLSALLVVGVTIVGAGGVFASPQIHGFQGSALESSHDWQGSIHEFELSGQQAPNAPDIARVLDEQGEQQTAQGHYAAAIETFNIVSTKYSQSGSAVSRANTDTFDAYSRWINSNATDVDYLTAITFFESYRISASCTASCASDASAVEAQAEYQYGNALFTAGMFNDAIMQFEAVTTNLATSSYATQAHEGAAKAFLGLAQQETSAGCEDFTPQDPLPAYTTLLGTYQTLVAKYDDTPEGAQAKTALAAPQDAVGIFDHAVSNTTLYLSKHYDVSTGDASQDYTAKIGASGTIFTFDKVVLGSYYLSGVDNTGTPFYFATHNQPIPFAIKPLCTNDIVEILN